LTSSIPAKADKFGLRWNLFRAGNIEPRELRQRQIVVVVSISVAELTGTTLPARWMTTCADSAWTIRGTNAAVFSPRRLGMSITGDPGRPHSMDDLLWPENSRATMHDAELLSIAIDYVSAQATLILRVWVGDPSSAEAA
jgi:hypothetical protein